MTHHGISGLVGKIVTEIEVHCDADEYYKIFEHHEDVPNAVPHLFTGVKVIKGDGICSGSVRNGTLSLVFIFEHADGKTFSATEESTHTDETRTVHHRIFEGDFIKDFKKFDSVIQVKPKPDGKGSIVSWSMVYEKRNEDVPAPFAYLPFVHQSIMDMNKHLCASE